jgi:hypothetical protein
MRPRSPPGLPSSPASVYFHASDAHGRHLPLNNSVLDTFANELCKRDAVCFSLLLGSVRVRASDWSASSGPAIAPPLMAGVDENSVCRMRVSGRHQAIRTHRARLPQVPLPHMRQAVQRAVRHGAEPGAIPLRHHCSRSVLAPGNRCGGSTLRRGVVL